MYLHQVPVCREGCISTCSKGKGSCPEGHYGGWGCNGCLYNDWDEYITENGIDGEVPEIFKLSREDMGNVNLHLDVGEIKEAIQEVKKNKKFTQYQIMEYIMGWATDGQHWFDIDDIKSILHNSLAMLKDEQDGIKATFDERRVKSK